MKRVCIPGIEECIVKIKNRVTKQDRMVFLGAAAVSVVFYFPMLAAWLGNPDSFWNGIVYKHGSDWENRLGRFGLTPIYKLKEYYISPTGSTFLSFLMLALICVLLRRLFKIRQSWLAACMVLLVELTPSVLSTLTYYYCSDAYFFAYFLNVAAVYVLTLGRRKRDFILAVVMMAYALSCYQAYISVAAVLCLFILWKMLLEDKKRMHDIVRLAGKYIIAALSAGIVYAAAFQAVQMLFAIEPAEKFAYPGLKGIAGLIVNTYRYFIQYFFTNGFLYNDWGNRKYWNAVFVIVSAILSAVFMIGNRKRPLRVLAILVCMLCMPTAFLLVTVLAPGTSIYGETGILMLPAMNYVYLVPVLLLSLDGWRWDGNWLKTAEWVCGLLYLKLTALLAAFVFAFQGYMQLNLNRMVTIAGEVVSQIATQEELHGAADELPVVFAGELPKIDYHNALIDAAYGTTAEHGLVWSNYDSMQQSWMYFLKHMAGRGYETVAEEDFRRLSETEQFREMPLFPAAGSVDVIEGIIVVKLNAVSGE